MLKALLDKDSAELYGKETCQETGNPEIEIYKLELIEMISTD
jgi:hypothetical protein